MPKVVDGHIAEETTMIGLTYLGQQSITMTGASQALTLPAGTNFVEINAALGDVQYTINAAASANSGGFVPENMVRYIPKCDNLASLYVFGTAPAVAHVNYYQEP